MFCKSDYFSSNSKMITNYAQLAVETRCHIQTDRRFILEKLGYFVGEDLVIIHSHKLFPSILSTILQLIHTNFQS